MLGHAVWCCWFLAKPLRVSDRAIEIVTGFIKLELATLRSLCRFCQKSCNLGRPHRLKTAGGTKSLLKNWHRIAASDDDTGGKTHCVLQTLDRCNRLASENNLIAHRFHAENSDALLAQHRQDLLFKTVEVSVHHIERHLNGIEPEAVLGGGGQHLQMDLRTLVPCEADKT